MATVRRPRLARAIVVYLQVSRKTKTINYQILFKIPVLPFHLLCAIARFAGCSQTGSADKLPLVKTVIGLFATTDACPLNRPSLLEHFDCDTDRNRRIWNRPALTLEFDIAGDRRIEDLV
ncbi:MAG: hypothetical protein HC829_03640 [Bacteroidales bacterium]|nr:hypothetical protein [Bacteroidales bacterium]